PMESAKDHKKVYNNEEGPNTGGMGTFSPSDIYDEQLSNIVKKEVLDKTLKGFKDDNLNYKGILFIGLMITDDGPK
ncbi:phosphoribosylamine--glycine ligase, partial [bacterium 210820-DFI.6.52]|nr:phosphoribosylamine--glycine ligase [bacterium 210820-DFI.6.52]